jgi:hypothetical protein
VQDAARPSRRGGCWHYGVRWSPASTSSVSRCCPTVRLENASLIAQQLACPRRVVFGDVGRQQPVRLPGGEVVLNKIVMAAGHTLPFLPRFFPNMLRQPLSAQIRHPVRSAIGSPAWPAPSTRNR